MMHERIIDGVRVLYKENDSKITTVRFAFNVGSNDETDKKLAGAAHFMEHLMFKRTSQKGPHEINLIMSGLGDVNAYTNHDRTVYYINCLNVDWDRCVDILAEIIFDNNFNSADFKLEKNVVLEEMQSHIDNPQSYFFKAEEDAYGADMHPVIGVKKSITNITPSQIRNFKVNNYTLENMALIVCGGHGISKKISEVVKRFSNRYNLPHGSRNDSVIKFTNDKKVLFDHNSKQCIMAYYYPDVDIESNVSDAATAWVFSNGFGGAVHSMLFSNIREKMGLCYSISFNADTVRKQYMPYVFAVMDVKNIDRAMKEIDKQIHKVKNEGFKGDMLDISKSSTKFGFCHTINSYVGYAIHYGDGYNVHGLCFDPDAMFAAIADVKNSDIMEFANRVITDKKLIMMNGK